MATGGITASATTVNSNSSSNSNNNNNNNNNNNISNNNNNITPPNNSSNITIVTTTTTAIHNSTADAATVAIAKDMLQLHHGVLNNNNNNNNNNTNSSNNSEIITAPTTTATATAATTSPGSIGGVTIVNTSNANAGTGTASGTTINLMNTHTNPPAHASSTIANVGSTQQQQQQQATTATVAATAANVVGAGAQQQPDNALGFLKYEQEQLYITEPVTIIGRNSSTSHVHFHVAENNLVSRKHFQLLFDAEVREFFVQCLSKNGIFVDDFLQRRNVDPLKLPESCFFRFPSTEIRIQFESFLPGSTSSSLGGGSVSSSSSHSHGAGVGGSTLHNNNNHHQQQQQQHHLALSADDHHQAQHHQQQHPQQAHHHHHHQQHHHHSQHHQQQQQPHSTIGGSGGGGGGGGTSSHLLSMDNYTPLKISIPKKEEKSPYLSPTGTISAANSCPASPRQGFHQNQANYNNNYGNNNLQNQQELFQTPSTASYNHNEKPPYSYAQLIVQAISAAPDKQLTLSGIYSFIVKHYPYYRKETNKGWQNSIRHNLSLNRYFIKVARSQDEPGKGSFWRIDPDSGAKLIDHSYKKRRQRSSQSFRPSYGMPRSAPVSPSHMDNSRESSPLQDIVLQSAPGSPGMSIENRAADSDMMYSQTAANNSHSQYSSGSPYYVSNQQQGAHGETAGGGGVAGGGGGGGANSGNGVAALIALKRNHAMAAGAANASAHQQQQQQPQQGLALHQDLIYEEVPTDYSGNMESGDECDAAGGGGGGATAAGAGSGEGNGATAATAATAAKRPKYLSEVH